VAVVDTATDTRVATVPFGEVVANGVVFSPDGKQAYVSTSSGHAGTAVSVIHTATGTVIAAIPVDQPNSLGQQDVHLAVSADGSKLYVAGYPTQGSDAGQGTVTVIDTATRAITATIPVGTNPSEIVLSPDGSRAYVPNSLSNTVSVINVATDSVTATIATGTNPTRLALSPDGSRAYLVNTGSKTVSVIDTATNTTIRTLISRSGAKPVDVAMSPNGTTAYVADRNGQVLMIDLATNTVIAYADVSSDTSSSHATRVTVSADGSRLYNLNNYDGLLQVTSVRQDL
jgi:YVTN family beta-propeller protein